MAQAADHRYPACCSAALAQGARSGGISENGGSASRLIAPLARDREQATALAAGRIYYHLLRMYVVTEADAAAIREACERGGELSAAVELRRRFPGITDNATAREQARRIAAWLPLPDRSKRIRRAKPMPVRGNLTLVT